jgi:predicted PurR-regulated permease PerM
MPDPLLPSPGGTRVDPRLEKLAAYCIRLIPIGVVAVALVWLLRELRVLLAAVVIAVVLTRILVPVSRWLRRHRWRPGLAAATTLVGFFLVLTAVAALITLAVSDEVEELGPTIEQALDDIEDWLVDDAPFDVDRATVDQLRDRAGDAIRNLLDVSGSTVVDSATLAGEVLTVLLLSVIFTFFLLRDGRRFAEWAYRRIRADQRPELRAAGERGWSTLGAYVRGVAILGLVEAVVIGLTLWIAGGGLVAPVMVLTFVLAFIPILGAIAAGVIAVLVALVTGGIGTAVVVAIVAVIVQQLDNDLLAPVIYGRALALHPMAVLVSVTAGGALFGIAGTVLAVPVVAVAVSVGRAIGEHHASGGT